MLLVMLMVYAYSKGVPKRLNPDNMILHGSKHEQSFEGIKEGVKWNACTISKNILRISINTLHVPIKTKPFETKLQASGCGH